MSVMSRSVDFERLSDLVRDADERAHFLAWQGMLGLDLSALEPVQHLLQPDLNVLLLHTVAAKDRRGGRTEDQERQERERREQSHSPKGASRRGPQAQERSRAAEPLPAAITHVRDQLDMAEAALERRHLAGDLGSPREREAAAPRSERPLNRRERADLRRPGGAVVVASLHLEQLLLLHPGAERAIDREGLTGDHALRGEPSGAHQPCQQAAACLGGRAGPLFEQRLAQIARRDPDLLAEREQFWLGEPLADVLLAGLQLRGALDDALQRVATNELARHRYASAFVFSGAAGSLSPDAFSGSAGVATRLPTLSRNPRNSSSGRGKMVVELFSEAISVTV